MELNKEQSAAVRAPLVDISVLAGAGSGKTRVIVERIVFLIENFGISPHDVVALTYTRRAANEMKERLIARIGRKAHQLFVGTIHGWCLNQLYRYGDAIGWAPATMSVFSADEAKMMLNFTLEDLGFMKNGKLKGIKRRDLDRAFLNLETTSTMPSEKDLCRVLTAFARGCKESNALTYPMILGEALKLLNVPYACDIIKNEVKHLILDEVQDTTPLQFKIVSLLHPETRYLVGDIRQSIFGFAGADISNTKQELNEGQEYHLSVNYRSPEEIVMAGNMTMSDHLPLESTFASPHSAIEITPATSENIEDIVVALLEDGFMPSDIAILCRAHRPLAKCVRVLQELDFPVYYPKAKGDTYKDPEVQKLHALLTLTVNPWDVFAFRTVAADWEDTVKRQSIITKAKTEMIPIAHAWNIEDECAPDDFLLIPAQLIECPLVCEGLKAFGVSPDDFAIKPASREELNTKIANYLKWVALRDLQANQEKIPENHIQALSIHQSKGLEFGAVVLVGASEGILPSRQSKTPEDIEEERRLFYVAVTRAKDRLIICPRPDEEESRFLSAVK